MAILQSIEKQNSLHIFLTPCSPVSVMCFTGQVECSNKAADDFKSIHAAPLDRKLRKLSRSTFFFNQISLHSTTKTFAICTSQRNDNQSSEYTLTSVYAVFGTA